MPADMYSSSILEVRNRICVELLVTVEASKGKGSPLNSLLKSESMIYDTERVVMFSKFLAEEWDLDYLALFLNSRDILQNHFSIKFRELAMQGVRSPDDPFDYPEKLRDMVLSQLRVNEEFAPKTWLRPLQSDTPALPPVPATEIGPPSASAMEIDWADGMAAKTRQSESQGSFFASKTDEERSAAQSRRKKRPTLKPLYASEAKERVVPIALPATLYFVPDAGLLNAPSLAIHISSLPVCCELVLPKCHSKYRKHLSERIILGVKRRLEAVAPVMPGVHSLDIDDSRMLIPISVVLCTICEEWRLMPAELREKFGSVGQAALSLEKLNDVYAQNCVASKERLEEIKQTEVLLSQCKATMATLEKKIRRLERRWKENRKHATNDELESLQGLRVSVSEEETRRLSLESALKGMRNRHNRELTRVDLLWGDALKGEDLPTNIKFSMSLRTRRPVHTHKPLEEKPVEVSDDPIITWRNDISDFFIRAVKYNVEQVAILKADKVRNNEILATTVIKGSSTEIAPDFLLHSDLSLDEYMVIVRKRAEDLANVGPDPDSSALIKSTQNKVASSISVPVEENSPEYRALQHSLIKTVEERSMARQLVADVLVAAQGGVMDSIELWQTRQLLAGKDYETRDTESKLDLLASSIVSICERRLVLSEFLGIVSAEIDVELNNRTDALTSQYMDIACDALISKMAPIEIDNYLHDIVNLSNAKAEDSICEDLFAAALSSAVNSFVDNLSTASTFVVLENATAHMILDATLVVAREQRERKDREMCKIIKYVLNGIITKVEDEMSCYDPKWSPLEEEPKRFMTYKKLAEVEAHRAIVIQRQSLVYLRNGIIGFKRIVAIKEVQRKGNAIYSRILWDRWQDKCAHQQAMVRAVIRMQAVARVLCRKRQVATLRVYEKKIQRSIDNFAHAKNIKYMKCVLAMLLWRAKRNKNLLRLYHGIRRYRMYRNYTYWREKYLRVTRHHRLVGSAVIIQCALRSYLAKLNVFKRRFARIIVFAARNYICRSMLRARKDYLLRVHDILALKRSRYEHRSQKIGFSMWWRLSSRSRGMVCINRTWNRHVMRRGINKLWAEVLAFRQKKENAVTLINAVVRRFVDQRQVLHYAKFSRGLRRMQAKVRGLAARKEYAVLLYLHAMTTKIQKTFRGWKCREDMTNARIRDLHYGAMTNNFEKVQYYIDKYPELMVSIDHEGSNLLHSAAAGAAKRTMKLILKNDRLDLNTLNYNGYSPLHMLIMSTAANRDQMLDYMTEKGFDEFQITSAGKTCLLLATEFARLFIGQILVEDGLDGTLADNQGLTALQAACIQGLPRTYLSRLINYANCDAHCPGQYGRLPLHDAADEGTLDNVDFLIWRGVDINARGIQIGETALMLACKKGHEDVAKFLLLQGCNAKLSDYYNQNAAHYVAHSDSIPIIDLLREADVDINQVDQNGDTPLHVAASIGASAIVKSLLAMGAMPSVQNYVGNQPSHLAAAGNHVSCLKELMTFEQYIGRMNYAHRTPLGMAKFHCAREAQAFLEHNYIFFLDEAERNQHGDIWWDKPIDEAVAQWELSISPHGKRTFHNLETGEVSDMPPSMPTEWISHFAQDAKLPLTQKVHLKTEVQEFSAHQYLLDQDEEKKRVAEARAVYRTATIICKWARRKLVYNLVRRTKHRQVLMQNFSRWIWRVQYKLKRWRKARKSRCAITIQSRWRGHACRHWLYYSGEHYQLWYNRAGRYLKGLVWRAWKNHLVWRLAMKLTIVATAPKRIEEWQNVLDEAGLALRKFGLFEEYGYPGSMNLIKFYRNTFNGQFSFHQPTAWAKMDRQELIDARFMRVYGYIPSHMRAATMMQALWRGFVARKQFMLILKAARISLDAEVRYLEKPDDNKNLFNYALYCHAFKLDYDRARLIYQEAIQRMEHAGPDIAQILYAYGIFCLVSYYQDERECLELIKRGKKAEENAEVATRLRLGIEKSVSIENGTFTHGKVFDTADVGFFKRAATHIQDSENWHNYAVSRWLVYNDFSGAFDAFMNAFTTNSTEIRLRANFELMMTYFHGYDKEYKTMIIQQRNLATAQKECDRENERLEFAEIRFRRNKAALLIQRFCRHHLNRKHKSAASSHHMSEKSIAYML